jgi:hypothetical protein
MNRGKVKNIIKALEDDLKRYSQTVEGTPDDVANRGRPDGKAVGGMGDTGQTGYPAGKAVFDSMTEASRNISTAYTQFLASYQQVIDALHQTVGNSGKADQGSTVNGGQTNPNQSDMGT